MISDFRKERDELIFRINMLSENDLKKHSMLPILKPPMRISDLPFFAEQDDYPLPFISRFIGFTSMIFRSKLLLIFIVITGSQAVCAQKLPTKIIVTRQNTTQWEVKYTFDEPVSELNLGPAVVSFRTDAWKFPNPNIKLISSNGEEKIISFGGSFSTLRVIIDAYSEFPPNNYVPIAMFSDGGAAFFLGFLTGSVKTDEGSMPMKVSFKLNSLAGGQTIQPDHIDKESSLYAYFGSREPVKKGHVYLIMDPGTPDWLKKIFEKTVSSVSQIYSRQLNHKLSKPPLAIIAAGDLENFNGYSIKGGAVNGEFIMMLRGRNLLEQSVSLRKMFEKLTAHELAHLWQKSMFAAGYNNQQPWIHEGSAEAMAVAALEMAGLWSRKDVTEFNKNTKKKCRQAIGSRSLQEAVDSGDWSPVYPCGYGLFTSKDSTPFELWSSLIRMAEKRESIYSQSMLENILHQLNSPSEAEK